MLAGASAAPSAQAKPDAKAATFEKIDQTFQGRPMKTNPTLNDYVAAGCWMNDRCCWSCADPVSALVIEFIDRKK